MSGIIVALDIEDKNKAIEIINQTRDIIDYVKLGYPIILNNGIKVLREISKLKSVISDLKIADIPEVSYNIAKDLTDNGSKGFIVHGFVGKDVLAKLRTLEADMYVVAEMSHPGSLDFISPISEKIAIMAKEIGADGLIAPATRPDRISKLKNLTNLKILSPGVGTQGGSFREAVKAGADYLIVGRSVTSSSNPREAILKIKKEMIA